jgi:hypothetical protein
MLGFLAPGTGGFLPTGGGGPFIEADDIGLGALTPPVFLRFAIDGNDVGPEPFWGVGLGGAAFGGLGAAIAGGLGAELVDDSGSDVYDDSRFAVCNQIHSHALKSTELTSCINTPSTLL